MHPYRMQRLIRERGKDQVINAGRRGGLYQTVGRLLRLGLIAVRASEQEHNRPERTIYEITDAGRQTLLGWMREMLSTPAAEFPAFPAALAHLALLSPEDARKQLELRARALEADVADIARELESAGAFVPRLFLIESEFLLRTRQAELDWVRALVGDLQSGRLTWNEEWLRQVAIQLEGGASGSAPTDLT